LVVDGKWVAYNRPHADLRQPAARQQYLGDSPTRRRADQLTKAGTILQPVRRLRENARFLLPLFFFTRRRIRKVYLLSDGEDSARVDETLDWRGYGEVVAGQKTISFTSSVYPMQRR